MKLIYRRSKRRSVKHEDTPHVLDQLYIDSSMRYDPDELMNRTNIFYDSLKYPDAILSDCVVQDVDPTRLMSDVQLFSTI